MKSGKAVRQPAIHPSISQITRSLALADRRPSASARTASRTRMDVSIHGTKS